MATTAAAVWGRAEQQDFRARVRGCLLGGALGDALGAGVDGLTLAEIRDAHGPDGLGDPAPAFGRRGAVTAATQMGLFTVDGLIRAQVRRDTGAWHPPTDVHRAHLRWAATQRDWGPDERRKDNGWLAHEEWLYARRNPPRACLTGLGDDVLGTLDQPKNPTADDSGALVRSAPSGCSSAGSPNSSASSPWSARHRPTAPRPPPSPCGAFAVVVHGLARGGSVEAAVDRALGQLAARPGHESVSEALGRALGAVREGIPDPDRVAALGAGRTGPRGSWRRPSTAPWSARTYGTGCGSR